MYFEIYSAKVCRKKKQHIFMSLQTLCADQVLLIARKKHDLVTAYFWFRFFQQPKCRCPYTPKDHCIRSHHFMGNRWGNSGKSVRLIF